MKEDPSTVPEGSSAKAKSRVASFLTAFTRKKKTAEEPPVTQDGPVRPAIGSVPAALFLDSKGKIVTAHPRCAGFFGRQPNELTGLNIKDLLKPGSDQEITNILSKGRGASELPFHVVALRKDGSEFATQFSFKFLQDFRFRWAVFVLAPAGSFGDADRPAREPKAIVPTTETATTETPEHAPGEKPPARLVGNKDIENHRATRQFPDMGNRNLTESNAKARAELDKEREAIKVSQKKEEIFQTQFQTLQGALEQAEARAHESAPQSKDWEKKAANLKKCVDELTRRHAAEQNAAIKAAQRVKELEEQLKRAGDNQAAGKKDNKDQNDTRHRLKAENRDLTEANAKAKSDLDKERDAIKGFLEKEEKLQAQVQKLRADFEIAEAHARESAAQSRDWEQKATDLKKSVDELTKSHAAEQNAAAKAAQRVKELEEQIKRAGEGQAADKKENKDQGDTRHRLKAENCDLTEANAKARADLDKEREAIKVSRKKEEELQAQVQKLQGTLEQAEARAHESATQSKDWEKKAADFKKSVDELTRKHAAEQSAVVKAGERVKELEQQLMRPGNDQPASKKEIEDKDATRQRLEAENRNLTEANAKARTDLDKERDAIKGFLKKEEALQTQVQKLQGAVEIAEAHARESAAQSKDWEKKVAELKKSVDELTCKHAGDDRAAGKKDVDDKDATRQHLESENRNLIEANAKARADLEKERDAIKVFLKKEEQLQAQVQKLQGAVEIAEAHARESAAQSKDWEKKAADLKKSVDELTESRAAEHNAAVNAGQRVKELEEQLKRAENDDAAGKKEIEDQDATSQRLEAEVCHLIEANDRAKADLEKERVANKLSQKKEVELDAQVQKLKGALEQAEANVRESAAQSKDWEKKAADFKKSVDELARKHAAEQNAAVKAGQRVKELEEQLKRAGDDRAAGKKTVEDQDAARQRLESENRKLIEANDRTKADLEKEHVANKLSREKEQELEAQVQKLKGALEQAEAHARESAAQSKDWEKKAADFKKSVDELARKHAAEQNAAVKAGQRVKELEEQLKRAGDDQAAGKKNIEDRDATRQRLEAENRKLIEADAKVRADLDREREAIKVSLKKEEALQAELQKLKGALEQAEAHARESAAQSKDWEKKAADFKKSVDELARKHAAEQNAAVKAGQRVKELEEQLKRAEDEQAAGKKNIEDQTAARHRLEAENRKLAEANAKATADFDKEHEAIKVSRKKEDELETQVQKLQGALERAEARARESAAQSNDWEKKAADLKKSINALTESHDDQQSAAAKQIRGLEQKLKRAEDDLAAEKRNLTESAEKQAALEKKVDELELRARQNVSSLAKANAELESQRAERERAEKRASFVTAQMEDLKEKLKRQVELQRASQSKMAELERTIDDRIEDLARVSVALRDQAKERQLAQKQSRLASEMDNCPEPNPAPFEETKKVSKEPLNEDVERVKIVECTLEANSGLEKELAERRCDERLLDDARQQLEKLSAEIFTRASRMYNHGQYADCHELMEELMGILNERISIFNDAWNLHTQTLVKLGRFDEAKVVAQQRIKAIEDRLGKKHPSLMGPLNNLAAIFEKTGFVFEAEQATRRALSIRKMFESEGPLKLERT